MLLQTCIVVASVKSRFNLLLINLKNNFVKEGSLALWKEHHCCHGHTCTVQMKIINTYETVLVCVSDLNVCFFDSLLSAIHFVLQNTFSSICYVTYQFSYFSDPYKSFFMKFVTILGHFLNHLCFTWLYYQLNFYRSFLVFNLVKIFTFQFGKNHQPRSH